MDSEDTRKHIWGRGGMADRASLDPDSLYLDRESIERNEWARTLANSLGGLVRSARNATEATLGPLTDRLRAHWMEKPEVWLELSADGVIILDEPYLEDRAWVMAAFVAGVQRIRPTDHLGELDCLRLAGVLASLRPTADSIENFRDWLWADGAEGFEVELRGGFGEGLDTILAAQRLQWRARAFREDDDGPPDDDSVRITISDVDEDSIDGKYAQALRSYTRTLAKSHADQISDLGAEAARQRFEDGKNWAVAEFEAAVNQPALRDAMPPQRLARQLISRMSHRTDRRLLRYVAKLMLTDDEFAERVTLHLQSLGLGRALANGTHIEDKETRETLIRFLQVAKAETAGSLAAGLLGRGGDDEQMAGHVAEIIRRHGAERFFERLDSTQLDEAAGALLLDTLIADEVPPGLLRRALLALPARATIAWLEGCPDARFWSLEGVIRQLLKAKSQRSTEQLVRALEARNGKQAGKFLAEVIEAGAAERWSRRALGRALRMIVRAGLGQRYALHWIGEQSTSPILRVAAIKAVREDPGLLAILVKRRFTEFMDPTEVKEALKDARRLAKTSSQVSMQPERRPDRAQVRDSADRDSIDEGDDR